jgi:hypothetical protein
MANVIVVPASELAGALTELAATAAENEQLRSALADIRDGDQRERLTTVEVDSAGNTYEVEMVDGPWARIARAALDQAGDVHSTSVDERDLSHG